LASQEFAIFAMGLKTNPKNNLRKRCVGSVASTERAPRAGARPFSKIIFFSKGFCEFMGSRNKTFAK